MCWTSYIKPIRFIAHEDIKCYTVFNKTNIVWNNSKIKEIISLYRNYLYIPYNINPEINIVYPNYLIDFIYDEYSYCIQEGYHSYSTFNIAKLYSNNFFPIIECSIPKGSEYYVNEDHEIVSSNIIVTDKIVK